MLNLFGKNRRFKLKGNEDWIDVWYSKSDSIDRIRR